MSDLHPSVQRQHPSGPLYRSPSASSSRSWSAAQRHLLTGLVGLGTTIALGAVGWAHARLFDQAVEQSSQKRQLEILDKRADTTDARTEASMRRLEDKVDRLLERLGAK